MREIVSPNVPGDLLQAEHRGLGLWSLSHASTAILYLNVGDLLTVLGTHPFNKNFVLVFHGTVLGYVYRNYTMRINR